MTVAVADDQTLFSTLDTLDEAVNYLQWIVGLARDHLAGPILEIGAGHGTFTGELAAIGHVHALEPDGQGVARLHQRYGSDDRVTITHGTIADVAAEPAYGSAVMINVLEHIADDAGTLREVLARLRPGGTLVLWVPAFELLYSDFDRQLGHHRRYRRAQLVERVAASGFVVERAHYVNLPGWFAWLVITRLLRRRPTAGPLVLAFDRYVVPVVRRIERWRPPPFGQSIVLMARKPDGDAPPRSGTP